jgi:hypothetical protein
MSLKIGAILVDTALQSTSHNESAMLKQDPKKEAKQTLELEYRKELEMIAASLYLDCCDDCIRKNNRIQFKTTY